MAATWTCARCGADTDTQLGVCRACGAVRGAVVTPPAPSLPEPPLAASTGQPPMPPAPPSFAVPGSRGGASTSGQTHTSERTGRGILVGVVLAVILALTVLVAAISVGPRLAGEASGTAGPQSAGLKVGDCFGSPDSHPILTPEGLSQVTAIPCAESHLFEVFFLGTISGDGVLGSAEWTDRYCSAAFTHYTGTAPDASPLNYFAVGPDAARWAAGDREIRCVLADLNLNPLTRSMKASGDAGPADGTADNRAPALGTRAATPFDPSPHISVVIGPDEASWTAGRPSRGLYA